MRKRARNALIHFGSRESGHSTLTNVLILLVLGGLIVTPITAYMRTGLEAGQTHERRTKELYSADAGVNHAMWQLQWNGATVPEGEFLEYQFTLNDKTVDVTIEEPETDIYKITSIATTDENSSTTVEAHVAWVPTEGSSGSGWPDMDPTGWPSFSEFELGPGEEYVGNVYSEQNVKLGEGASIEGNVYAEANVILEKNAVIDGDVQAGGNVQLGEGAQILGNVYSFANTQLEISGYIEGHVIAEQGNVQLKPNGIIGSSVCSGQDTQLDIGAQIVGDVHAMQNVDLYEDAIVGGDVYVGQTLNALPDQYGEAYEYDGCPLSESGNTDYELDVLSYTIK